MSLFVPTDPNMIPAPFTRESLDTYKNLTLIGILKRDPNERHKVITFIKKKNSIEVKIHDAFLKEIEKIGGIIILPFIAKECEEFKPFEKISLQDPRFFKAFWKVIYSDFVEDESDVDYQGETASKSIPDTAMQS